MTRRERLRLALSVSYVDLPRLQPITLKSDETILTRRERVLLAVALVLAILAIASGPVAQRPSPTSPLGEGARAVSAEIAR